MFRTVDDQLSLWDVILPSELLVLPDELARVRPAHPATASFRCRGGPGSVAGRGMWVSRWSGSMPGGSGSRETRRYL